MGHGGALLWVTQGQVALSWTSGGNAAVYPEKVCDIILACAVLHNIALDNGAFDVPAQPDEPMHREPWPAQPPRGYTEETGPHSSLLKCKVYLNVV